MRTLIESKLSGLYFQAFGRWVSDTNAALTFPDFQSAREFIEREHLADVRPITVPDRDELGLSAA